MTARIEFTGNAGGDLELRFTQSGKAVGNVSVAVTPRRRNAAGEWEDAGVTAWYRCSVWGALAEHLAEHQAITKGTRVTVTGDLKPEEYDGKPQLNVTVRTIAWEPPRGQQPRGQQSDPWATGGGGSRSYPSREDEPPFDA